MLNNLINCTVMLEKAKNDTYILEKKYSCEPTCLDESRKYGIKNSGCFKHWMLQILYLKSVPNKCWDWEPANAICQGRSNQTEFWIEESKEILEKYLTRKMCKLHRISYQIRRLLMNTWAHHIKENNRHCRWT